LNRLISAAFKASDQPVAPSAGALGREYNAKVSELDSFD